MSNYRKALKNYSSTARIDDILKDIQSIIVDAGATGIAWFYDGNKRVEGVTFKIQYKGNDLAVKVPFSMEKVRTVLKKQNIINDKSRYRRDYDPQKIEDKVYRVTLANVRDWLDAQMTFLLLDQVELPQLFLPYVQTNDGRTVYEHVLQNNVLALPEHND